MVDGLAKLGFQIWAITQIVGLVLGIVLMVVILVALGIGLLSDHRQRHPWDKRR